MTIYLKASFINGVDMDTDSFRHSMNDRQHTLATQRHENFTLDIYSFSVGSCVFEIKNAFHLREMNTENFKYGFVIWLELELDPIDMIRFIMITNRLEYSLLFDKAIIKFDFNGVSTMNDTCPNFIFFQYEPKNE